MARRYRKNPARRRREKKKAAANVSGLLPTAHAVDTPIKVRTPPSLMSLPGELRNHIYRLALLSPSRVQIRHDTVGQPGLLQTCHQIRNEAKPIYYKENEFTVTVTNFDFGLDMFFIQQCIPHTQIEVCVQLVHIGRGSWEHLLRGLKNCHEGRLGGLGYKDGQDVFWNYAARAFQMVKDLEGCPWPQVRDALDKYRLAVTEVPGKVRTAWREE
ncbi:hypothetical protein LTR36_008612 [Oleoguttula mirabilis]|uniref:Uncharacterized protein n=1 Tax=Oleoguttula mirabilis TaxID=1507867 RepID=A0AAV9JTI9_9PEZI|nr:hypothetical protein LTR36_008612 [Oleoguttula mirabilis]